MTNAVGPFLSGKLELTARFTASKTTSSPLFPDASGDRNRKASNAVAPLLVKTIPVGSAPDGTDGVGILVTTVCALIFRTETCEWPFATQTSVKGGKSAGRMAS